MEMTSFFSIIIIFWLCFANIYQSSEYYNVDFKEYSDHSHGKSYSVFSAFWYYLIETYNIFFGNWNDPTPKDTSMEWATPLI